GQVESARRRRRPAGRAARCPDLLCLPVLAGNLDRISGYFALTTSSIVVWKVANELALTLGLWIVPVTLIWSISFRAPWIRSPMTGSFGQLGLSVVNVKPTRWVWKLSDPLPAMRI